MNAIWNMPCDGHYTKGRTGSEQIHFVQKEEKSFIFASKIKYLIPWGGGGAHACMLLRVFLCCVLCPLS